MYDCFRVYFLLANTSADGLEGAAPLVRIPLPASFIKLSSFLQILSDPMDNYDDDDEDGAVELGNIRLVRDFTHVLFAATITCLVFLCCSAASLSLQVRNLELDGLQSLWRMALEVRSQNTADKCTALLLAVYVFVLPRPLSVVLSMYLIVLERLIPCFCF